MRWEWVFPGLAFLGAAWALTRKREALGSILNQPTPQPAPKPSPAPPKPPISPGSNPVKPTPMPSALHYQSLSANVVEKYGRGALKSGKGFTLAPLYDVFNQTWARTDWDTARDILAMKGLRMPTAAELDEIASRPDTLITPLCNQPPTDEMATKAWWDAADLCIQAALDIAGWDGKTPLMTLKAWEYVPPGQETYAKDGSGLAAWLHGMYVPKKGAPQPGGGYSSITQNRGRTAHNRKHVDYSQVIYGVEL